MKVYIVFWSDSFDDWSLEKVFSNEEKAIEFQNAKFGRWIMEKEVE
ncbi:hypothetical protein SAMN05877753_111142 [Bacillus oleivorans]|uniref:Uncharacterized protein n=1 Tax=Bacillus oleivorans TaxID=1448271 RepID=A0A285D665_9BACI|nr:hypothetical protein [Bacillus oleivorans]SNX75302.1 hypothetical protein SAMN05877753_111142 [Bacillus oleivorans]